MSARFPRFPIFLLLLLVLLPALPALADRPDRKTMEAFVFAPDRAKVLATLPPDTTTWYFLHCLHYQMENQLDKAAELLARWETEISGDRELKTEIRNRQALLNYPRDPAGTLAYLKKILNLDFPETPVPSASSPAAQGDSTPSSRLDPSAITWTTFLERALKTEEGIESLKESGLYHLNTATLSPEQRSQLLNRLTLPDYPNLVELIAQDLDKPSSRTFGSREIHLALTQKQLEALSAIRPDVLNSEPFVRAMVAKLQPREGADPESPEERKAYLDRLEAFAARLSPAFNSLKALVLLHRLADARDRQEWDRERFLAYLQLPQHQEQRNSRFLGQSAPDAFAIPSNWEGKVTLGALPDETALVTQYLLHLFETETDPTPFLPWLSGDFVRHCLAESRLLRSSDPSDQWIKQISQFDYANLCKRVELAFEPGHPRYYAAEDPVRLRLVTQNVPHLTVRVYALSPLSYLQRKTKTLKADVELEGATPLEERSEPGDTHPLQRTVRSFDFPRLNGRGLYLVEFSGAGKRIRALIQKGSLDIVRQITSAGLELTVVDEKSRLVPGAGVWLGNRRYTADERGRVILPFAREEASSDSILLEADGLAVQHTLPREKEAYSLQLGTFVSQEALLPGRMAQALLRPVLFVNEQPVTLSLLESPEVEIRATDLDGVDTVQTMKGLKLQESAELVVPFRVPDRLASMEFRLKAQVQNLSSHEKQSLEAENKIFLNGRLRTEAMTDLYLSRSTGGYRLEIRGRTGEPVSGHSVTLRLHHRGYETPYSTSLSTDVQGILELGSLPDIEQIEATLDGSTRTFDLAPGGTRFVYPEAVHLQSGEALRLPFAGADGTPDPREVSLLEKRNAAIVKDWTPALSTRSGFLEARELPPGDYSLKIRSIPATITIRIESGQTVSGTLRGKARQLDLSPLSPLGIAGLKEEAGKLKVQLSGSGPFTRVHLVATRFVDSAGSNTLFLSLPRFQETRIAAAVPLSLTATGNMDPEQRYILDRKLVPHPVGNLLERPGLLLNPRDAVPEDFAIQKMLGNGIPGGIPGGVPGGAIRGNAPPDAYRDNLQQRLVNQKITETREDTYSPCFGFLPQPAGVAWNLRPTANGTVLVPPELLAGHSSLQVYAVDPQQTVAVTFPLKPCDEAMADLRFTDRLDPGKHFVPQPTVTILRKGETLQLPGPDIPVLGVYDSLLKLLKLFQALDPTLDLKDWAFLSEWPSLTQAQRRTRYSERASHELDLFLARKDPAFFQSVVAPHLRQKLEKTFLDHYLLGDDLHSYLQPAVLARLNSAERVLLAERLPEARAALRQALADTLALNPPDPTETERRFRTALQGGDLEGGIRIPTPQRTIRDLPLNGRNPLDLVSLTPGVAETPPVEPPTEELQSEEIVEAPEEIEDQAPTSFYERDRMLLGNLARAYEEAGDVKPQVENQYDRVPSTKDQPDLIPPSAFWLDYLDHAAQAGPSGFLSTHLTEAVHTRTEVLLALALLDVPFTSPAHTFTRQAEGSVLTAAGPLLVFHEPLQETNRPATVPVQVWQNLFRADDRFTGVGEDRTLKAIKGDLQPGVVYGLQAVLSNPAPIPQRVSVLMQIPSGAIPLAGGRARLRTSRLLPSYGALTLESRFYFPAPGEFSLYPLQAGKKDTLAGAGEALSLRVRIPDTPILDAWSELAAHGSPEAISRHLASANLGQIDLSKLLPRLADPALYRAVVDTLSQRHHYDGDVWARSLLHRDEAAARDYLSQCASFVEGCGPALVSPLLTIDPSASGFYRQVEFTPIFRGRIHPFNGETPSLKPALAAQWDSLLWVLAHRKTLSGEERLAAAVYLLLQDRTGEARTLVEAVKPGSVAETLQHDYLRAYLACFEPDPAPARAIAARYADYPVDRWRRRFRDVLDQQDEITGSAPAMRSPEDAASSRERRMAAQATVEPELDLRVENRQALARVKNLKEFTLAIYPIDMESLFSREPFDQAACTPVDAVRPAWSTAVKVPAGATEVPCPLPASFQGRTLVVEVSGGSLRRTVLLGTSTLVPQMQEEVGQIKVCSSSGRPRPGVYVKVFARRKGGAVGFYKDGYTDVRGRFDYASVTGGNLSTVEKFSILVVDPDLGSVVREATPPHP